MIIERIENAELAHIVRRKKKNYYVTSSADQKGGFATIIYLCDKKGKIKSPPLAEIKCENKEIMRLNHYRIIEHVEEELNEHKEP